MHLIHSTTIQHLNLMTDICSAYNVLPVLLSAIFTLYGDLWTSHGFGNLYRISTLLTNYVPNNLCLCVCVCIYIYIYSIQYVRYLIFMHFPV